MRFTKVQGTGNDFILIDAGGIRRDWPQTAKIMCDRRFGIGGDGLLLLLPSKRADFRMRIFNADGSEAEMCGNGIRCLATYVFKSGLIGNASRGMSIETLAGIKKTEFIKSRGKLSGIKVGMGNPEFNAEKIPVKLRPDEISLLDITYVLNYPVTIQDKELALSFVSMGNPHAVYFTDKPVSEFPLSGLGPKVENHQMFPRRINFEVARVLSRELIEASVWERGAGETLACGTGACAVAVLAQLQGYVGNKVGIKLPGGTLTVEWDGKKEVFLSGPAEIVFTGEWPE